VSIGRMLARMGLTGGGYAASGVIVTSVGVKIMQTAGHVGYAMSTINQSAAGNAVIGAIVGAMGGCSDSKHTTKTTAGLGVLLAMAGNALGDAMVKDNIPLYETVIPAGVGGAAFIAGGVGFAIVVGLGYCIVQALSSCPPEDKVVATEKKPIAPEAKTETTETKPTHTTIVIPSTMFSKPNPTDAPTPEQFESPSMGPGNR